jgi:peptidoglycan/LPS O-acetylase OafA/YrhL
MPLSAQSSPQATQENSAKAHVGSYRPDIDGLRALAVIAVIIFHAFPKGLPGGFVGVDIFFVISGFLISTILFREFESGTFRYYKFMARRMRRIFPALCTVLLATFVGGWLLFTEQEFIALGKQTIAGSLFFANILFWMQDGYFDTASEFKPLLHLWSLGIEEQYYIFYPILLWAVYRWGRRWFMGILLAVFAASFLWSLHATKAAPASAFFLLPSRFWELLLGGFLAYCTTRFQLSNLVPALAHRPKQLDLVRHVTSIAGFLLMLAAIALTTKEQFPGYWALLPTVGAGLFIIAGPRALVNRHIFSKKFMVAVGLISYPLYLWHWPLISFEYVLAGARPANEPLYVALGLSILLSIATYYLIEKPIRHASIAKTYQYIFPLAPVAALLGAAILWSDGFPRRSAITDYAVQDGETDHVVFHEYGNSKYFECEASELRNNALHFNKTLRCHQSKPGTDYDIILLGDSHAEQLFYGLAEQLPDKNIVYAINFGLPVPWNEGLSKVYKYLLQNKSLHKSHLILTAAWALHPSDAAHLDGVRASVLEFQKAGYRVALTDDVPIFAFEPTLCKVERRLSLREQKCREMASNMEAAQLRIKNQVSEIAAATGATILHTNDFFREGDAYFMAKDGRLYYRDHNHLNINGSHYLAKGLADSGQLRIFYEAQSARAL